MNYFTTSPYVSCVECLTLPILIGSYLFLKSFKFIVYFCDAVKRTQGSHMLGNPFISPSCEFFFPRSLMNTKLP